MTERKLELLRRAHGRRHAARPARERGDRERGEEILRQLVEELERGLEALEGGGEA